MSDSPSPAGARAREEAVRRLSEAFADDALPVEEFERRVELVHEAETADELRELLTDLPSRSNVPASRDENAPRTRPSAQVESRLEGLRVPERSLVMGALGGAVRKGRWVPARMTTAVGILGGVELDLRDAILPPGVTEIRCFAIWGGIEIVVPPGVSVECDGVGIMGGFEQRHDTELLADPDSPVVRIRGVAVMGGVDVSARYPGESAREARKRLKAEKKERRRRLRGG